MLTPAEFYNILSDETRLRCLLLLYNHGKLCVCELMQALGSSQPKVSRHLSMLRNSGIVIDERRGQWVYYSLSLSLPKWSNKIIASNFDCLVKLEPYCSDIKRIHSLKKDNICTT